MEVYHSICWGRDMRSDAVVRNIDAEGQCAIVEMSAEQCQLIALQRARSAAIEKAAGVSVSSSSLVTNMVLAVDYIKTYSKGFIVKENVIWLPLGQYQKDRSSPPIPEYRVKIKADVFVPPVKINRIGLKARLNKAVFVNGEKAIISLNVARPANIAIFNIQADDQIVMIFPHPKDSVNNAVPDQPFMFPAKESPLELEVNTLPNHVKDAEAYFIVAADKARLIQWMQIFAPLRPMSFIDFFGKFSELAEYCEDTILPYEVHQ